MKETDICRDSGNDNPEIVLLCLSSTIQVTMMCGRFTTLFVRFETIGHWF